jgi:hypothetical protein
MHYKAVYSILWNEMFLCFTLTVDPFDLRFSETRYQLRPRDTLLRPSAGLTLFRVDGSQSSDYGETNFEDML